MPTRSEILAGLSWPILTRVAQDRAEPLFYGHIAHQIGTAALAMRYPLELIAQACHRLDLPALSALVVGRAGRVQGQGFWGDRSAEEIERIRSFDWASIENPFSHALLAQIDRDADEILEHPESSELVYKRAAARGAWQGVFRAALLKAYCNRCAFCGFGFVEALDAAHLVPWQDLSPARRAAPSSGLLLCANHHRLFDQETMWVCADMTIAFRDPSEADENYSPSDTAASSAIHGKRINLPDNPAHRPAVDLLRDGVEDV